MTTLKQLLELKKDALLIELAKNESEYNLINDRLKDLAEVTRIEREAITCLQKLLDNGGI